MDQRTHNSVQTRVQVSNPTPRDDHKRTSVTSAQWRAERSQREAGRPGFVCVEAKQVITDSRRKSKTSRRKSVLDGMTPRPADLGKAAGPTWRPPSSRLRVEVTCTDFNCLQSTPRASPAQSRPWKAINRAPILTCEHTPLELILSSLSRVG